MLPWQAQASRIFIAIAVFGLAGWSLYASVTTAPSCSGSICTNLRNMTANTPAIAFAWGCLTGHIFFINPNGAIISLIGCVVVLVMTFIFLLLIGDWIKELFARSNYFPGLVMFGIVFGNLFWPE
jgi:hypothetical protein